MNLSKDFTSIKLSTHCRLTVRKVKNKSSKNLHNNSSLNAAHRGMFCGLLLTVLTIISLIMFFVLDKEKKAYKTLAVVEVTYCEILLYIITSIAVFIGMYKMRDLKFSKLYCK